MQEKLFATAMWAACWYLPSCQPVGRTIALGEEAYSKNRDLIQKSLSLHLRKRLVKVFVWSVVLYGSETWTLQKEDV